MTEEGGAPPADAAARADPLLAAKAEARAAALADLRARLQAERALEPPSFRPAPVARPRGWGATLGGVAAILVLAALAAGGWAVWRGEHRAPWAQEAMRDAERALGVERGATWQDVGAALEAFGAENERLKEALTPGAPATAPNDDVSNPDAAPASGEASQP